MVLLLGVICGIGYYRNMKVSTPLATETHPDQQDHPAMSQNLINWINELELYECRNCPVDYKRIDNNGYYSYGCLQFQKGTFLENLKKFYPEIYANLEDEEWKDFVYDCDFQKELAYKMIEDDYNKWKCWKVSIGRGLNKPPVD